MGLTVLCLDINKGRLFKTPSVLSIFHFAFDRDKSLADDTSAQTTRMLQREDNKSQARPKNSTKNKRRKSRDLSESSLPPEQHPLQVSNSGPSQQQQQLHIQQRPRSSPAMDEQLVEMTAVLHNPGGTNILSNGGNNKSSATPAPSTRHSHSGGAHSPAIVQIVPQQQSAESSCMMASPSHPSQIQNNYHQQHPQQQPQHQQQVPQAYQPPDYYNIQPQPQPPLPSASTLQSRRHQLRSRESSRWSLSQENVDENMPSNTMEDCCILSSGNVVNGGSTDVLQTYCPIQACAGTALDLSDAPLPPPPSHQIFQSNPNNCSYVMSGSCSQDPLEIVVTSSGSRCYNTGNSYQPQNVTARLSRHSSSIEAIE